MNEDNIKMALVIALFLVLLVLLGFGPIFTIWSLNTLFDLEIPLNFKTWCATVWILLVLNSIKLTLRKDT